MSRLRKVFARHKCPADVRITVRADGREILGPVSGEHLALICRFGGYGPDYDLLNAGFGIIGSRVELFAERIPPERR